MTRTPSINMIFEKNNAGNYNPDSLLYQDILRYCRENADGGTKITKYDLVGWLLENNQEFYNYYKDLSTRHTRRAYRITSRWNRVMNSFNKFVTLQLVRKIGEELGQKGNIVEIYELTFYGKLISALYYYLNGKTERTLEEIYILFIKHFQNESSSLDKFCLLLLQKYQANDLFALIVDSVIDTIFSDSPVLTYLDLLRRSVPKTDDLEKVRKMVNLRLEAYNELSRSEKEMYLYIHKINIERFFLYSARSPANYEQGVSLFKGDAYSVVVEGFCKNCKKYSSAAVKTEDYIDRVYSRELVNGVCPNCKACSLNFPSSTRLLF